MKSEGISGKDYVEAGNLEKVPSSGIISVGITGTNGKTSVANILCGIFSSLGRRCGVIGTLGLISLTPGE